MISNISALWIVRYYTCMCQYTCTYVCTCIIYTYVCVCIYVWICMNKWMTCKYWYVIRDLYIYQHDRCVCNCQYLPLLTNVTVCDAQCVMLKHVSNRFLWSLFYWIQWLLKYIYHNLFSSLINEKVHVFFFYQNNVPYFILWWMWRKYLFYLYSY